MEEIDFLNQDLIEGLQRKVQPQLSQSEVIGPGVRDKQRVHFFVLFPLLVSMTVVFSADLCYL